MAGIFVTWGREKVRDKFECESAKSVGRRIAELRNEKGYTQKELADIIGTDRSMIGAWESGTRMPDVDSWIKLAIEFGVSCDYICGTSKSRVYKGMSISDKLDLERLNDLGRHMLFEYYHMLVQHEEFTKKNK